MERHIYSWKKYTLKQIWMFYVEVNLQYLQDFTGNDDQKNENTTTLYKISNSVCFEEMRRWFVGDGDY